MYQVKQVSARRFDKTCEKCAQRSKSVVGLFLLPFVFKVHAQLQRNLINIYQYM